MTTSNTQEGVSTAGDTPSGDAAAQKPHRVRAPKSARKTADGPFLWISHAAKIRARSAGRAHGLLVLIALAARAPINGSDFKASINNLAEESALSTRSVQRVLPLLVKARVIEMESGRGKGEAGSDTANTFRLLKVQLSNTEGGCPAATGRVTGRHHPTPVKHVEMAEDRELLPEGQRESYPPAYPPPAGAAAGLGGGKDDDAWMP